MHTKDNLYPLTLKAPVKKIIFRWIIQQAQQQERTEGKQSSAQPHMKKKEEIHPYFTICLSYPRGLQTNRCLCKETPRAQRVPGRWQGSPQGSSTIPTLMGRSGQSLCSRPAALQPCLPSASLLCLPHRRTQPGPLTQGGLWDGAQPCPARVSRGTWFVRLGCAAKRQQLQ